MSLTPMSHVEFNKCPCHRFDFRGLRPYPGSKYLFLSGHYSCVRLYLPFLSFAVNTSLANNDRVRVHVLHENESLPVDLQSQGDHEFKVTFTPPEVGQYPVSVYVGGLQVPGKSWTLVPVLSTRADRDCHWTTMFFVFFVCFTNYFVFSIAVLPHSPGVVYYHVLLR